MLPRKPHTCNITLQFDLTSEVHVLTVLIIFSIKLYFDEICTFFQCVINCSCLARVAQYLSLNQKGDKNFCSIFVLLFYIFCFMYRHGLNRISYFSNVSPFIHWYWWWSYCRILQVSVVGAVGSRWLKICTWCGF